MFWKALGCCHSFVPACSRNFRWLSGRKKKKSLWLSDVLFTVNSHSIFLLKYSSGEEEYKGSISWTASSHSLSNRASFFCSSCGTAASHHRSKFATYKPARVVNTPGGHRGTAHFHITACYIFICTVKMVGRYETVFHWNLAGWAIYK